MKNFLKKLKFLFSSAAIVEDVNWLDDLVKKLENKPFRDSQGNLCLVIEGDLYYSLNNGEKWNKSDGWSLAKDKKNMVHLAYSYKDEPYPKSYNIKST
jgi:hypothetical protein